jgi:fructokinase
MLPGGKQLGGAPANFAYQANALGAEGVVASSVGDDEPGREILGRLRSLGLDVAHVTTDLDHPTGRVDVHLDAAGVPDYVIHEGVAWDFLEVTPALLGLAARCDAVCFGALAQRSPPSRDAIRAFVGATRPACLRVFDVNLRQNHFDRATVHDGLIASDVLKLNDAELPVLAKLLGTGGAGAEAVRNLLLKYDLRLVALTHGPHGSALYTHDRTSDHPGSPPGKIADTVGAGDAFTAALVVGLLKGHDLDRINASANRLAGYVCSQPGATPPIPDEFRMA